MKIFKYALRIDDEQTVDLPLGAVILSVGLQQDELQMWALVDLTMKVVPRAIYIHGTGHEVPNRLMKRFIGTVQQGIFVWHVFEQGVERG